MELTLILLLAVFNLVVSDPPVIPTAPGENYQDHKAKYKKNYKNTAEDKKHNIEYVKNWNAVVKHNKNFEAGTVEYELKANKFADMFKTEREVYATGNIVPTVEPGTLVVRGKAGEPVNQTMFPAGPTAFDWTPSACTTPVKDQGSLCNSCWAFGALAGLEYCWCIKYGQRVSLSEQQLIDCNRNNATGNWGCDGGSLASSYMYIWGNGGIQNNTNYPYQEAVEHNETYSCRYDATSKVSMVSDYRRIYPLNETLLRDIVAAKGPVVAGMNADCDSFYFYSSGILDDPTCKPGTSHSVLIVGYGVSKRGTEFWICKNSWSTDWGMQGYFRIRRGVNRNGITGYLIYPEC